MSGFEMLLLAAAAALAGAVNAVAGGGTLITFPALLLCGTAPVIANATSTVALVIGTAGSIFGFRRQIGAVRPWLARFVPVSIAGGLLGSALLTRGDPDVFARLVPFLILFATVLFLAQGFIRRSGANGSAVQRGHAALGVVIALQFPVAVYGGYFGAGIGILMLAMFGLLAVGDIHEMNALKNVLGSLINLVAAAWFVASGLVDWSKALVMTTGALLGYFAGAHFSQRIPQPRVRALITVIGLTMSAVTFWRQFR
jgi:uncharacterized membrane protein YfcA